MYPYQIRIGDLNYGQHLAHDKLVTILHDARCKYFTDLEQSETNFLGAGLILTSLNIKYLGQAFLHDQIQIIIKIEKYSSRKLVLSYKVQDSNKNLIAKAQTDMVFFDYAQQCVRQLDKQTLDKLFNSDTH